MKILKLISFLLAVFYLTTAAAVTAANPDIVNVSGSLAQAYNKGRINELADLYTRNAVVMPPSSEILTTHPAIEQYWNGLRKAGFYKYSIYNIGIHIVGNTAYQTGLWQAVQRDPAGNEIKLDGNISNVLVRQKDGTWKIKMQSWN